MIYKASQLKRTEAYVKHKTAWMDTMSPCTVIKFVDWVEEQPCSSREEFIIELYATALDLTLRRFAWRTPSITQLTQQCPIKYAKLSSSHLHVCTAVVLLPFIWFHV